MHLYRGRPVMVDMQKHFVQPKSSGGTSSVREIVPHIRRLARAVRENAGLAIWIQNTFTDIWDASPLRHELQPSESAGGRIAARVTSCFNLGSKRAVMWVRQ
jgi:nicotinamidase-related amidase